MWYIGFMEPEGRRRGLFSLVSLWEQRSLQEGCIFKVLKNPATRAVRLLALLKSTNCWFFFVVPILMGVFSVTSIFSEMANGATFALVPHFPHNVRFSLQLGVGFDDNWQLFVCFKSYRVSCLALSGHLEISAVSFLSSFSGCRPK